MTVYKYLGYGVTNENGVAKLEYNSEGQKRDHSYTGVGAGEVDVLASLDKPITDGSIVSETYPLIDGFKYDSGTDSSNTMWALNNNAKLTRGTTYSTLEKLTTGSNAVITLVDVSLSDYRIECDVMQVDGTQNENVIVAYDNSWTTKGSSKGTVGEWKHITIDVTDASTNGYISISAGGSATKIYFKDFVVYPI